MIRFKANAGFSLVEVLLVVVLLGILSSLCHPILINILEESRKQFAICFAESVNAAKSSFWMRKPTAEQEYTEQKTNEDRYALIKEYLPHRNTSLIDALPQGYNLDMKQSIRDRVELSNKKGENVY